MEKLYVNCIVKHIKFRGCLAISAWQRFNLFLRKQYYLARGVGKLVHILVNTIPHLSKLLPRVGLSQPTGKGRNRPWAGTSGSTEILAFA